MNGALYYLLVCSPDLYVSPAKIIYSIISIYIRERGGFYLNNTDWGSKYITRRRRRIIRRPTKWFSLRFNNDVVIMTGELMNAWVGRARDAALGSSLEASGGL